MSDDLVSRLRTYAERSSGLGWTIMAQVHTESADEIERLRTENGSLIRAAEVDAEDIHELRAALERITNHAMTLNEAESIADDALAGAEQQTDCGCPSDDCLRPQPECPRMIRAAELAFPCHVEQRGGTKCRHPCGASECTAEPASAQHTDEAMLRQAARLLRDYEGDAHPEDVPDVTRWLAVYDSRTARLSPPAAPETPASGGQWQPIATFTRRDAALFYSPDDGVQLFSDGEDDRGNAGVRAALADAGYTHWMDLPSPPAAPTAEPEDDSNDRCPYCQNVVTNPCDCEDTADQPSATHTEAKP